MVHLVNMSSSAHANNKKFNVLVPGESINKDYDKTLIAEKSIQLILLAVMRNFA